MIVRIEPIPLIKWHRKKGEEDPLCKKRLYALVNYHTNEYDTGLSYSGVYDHPDNKEKLTEAEYYGKILKQDLSNTFKQNEPHPFWDSLAGMVTLDNKPFFLDTSIPVQHIKYKICLASRLVANSMEDFEKGLYPNATHVIVNKEHETETKIKTIEKRNKAILGLSECNLDKKRQVLTFINKIPNNNLSDNEIMVKLDEIIQRNPEKITEALSIPKEDMTLYTLVYTSINYGVLKNNKTKGVMYEYSTIAMDIRGMIEYLKDDLNQEFRLHLMDRIANKL
jgi:hypothetical protein